MNDPQPEGHMASHIGRRRFLAAVGGAAAAWPRAARGQQAAMPVIGVLHGQAPDANADRLRGFHRGLKDSGYVEGENLPELAADLVRRRVAVIVTSGGPPPALAAKFILAGTQPRPT